MTHPTDLSRPSCVSGGAFVEPLTDAPFPSAISRVNIPSDIPGMRIVGYRIPDTDAPLIAAIDTLRKRDACVSNLLTALRTARDLLAHHAPQVPTEKWIDGMATVDAALKKVGG